VATDPEDTDSQIGLGRIAPRDEERAELRAALDG
jgi:hypothetical protein